MRERRGCGDTRSGRTGRGTGRDDRAEAEIDELLRDRFIIGAPGEVTESIVRLARGTGVNHLVVGMHRPGMETAAAMDAMRLFTGEVIPAVRQAL